ncbi:MAG: helix-turn-helix domain-containing protein [Dermatophilaceae bacterium]|nr:winged helix-turn-helix transcriptional regulator [Actinomycetales bacterium]
METSPRPVDAFKALGHEVRLKIFYAVAAAEEATATMLGEELGMSPAATSYHLGKLGKFGLLEEVEDQSRDGRERWWRVASGGLEFPSDSIEAEQLQHAVLRHHRQRLAAFLAARDSSPEKHRNDEVAFSSDMIIKLSKDRAARFQREVADLLKRYSLEGEDGDQVTFVMLQGLPYE